jgi:ribonuclease P protein component
MGKFVFRKEERLNKERWIKELFEKGSSFHLYPFRVLFLPHPDQSIAHTQVLISIPTRNFKRAVDRNKLKRRIREGYRLNKQALNNDQKWLIAYIYTAKEIQQSPLIHEKILNSFGKLSVPKA